MIWIIILLILITALLATIVGFLIGASQVGLRQDIASLRTEISGLTPIVPSLARLTKAKRIADQLIADQLAEVDQQIKAIVNEIAAQRERESENQERVLRTNEELEAIRQQLEKTAEKLSEIHDAVRSLFD